MVRQLKETREEKKARELREAYAHQYETKTEEDVKNRIIELLDEIDDTEDQRKAYNDTMKELIDDKKDELIYCRQRRQYLRSAQGIAELEAQADQLLSEQ